MKFKWENFRLRSRDDNKPQSSSQTEFIDKLDSNLFILCLIVLGVWLVSAASIIMPYSKNNSEILIKDQRAPTTIFAECDFSYIDEKMTANAREQASLNEPAIYRVDTQISELIISRLKNALNPQGKTEGDQPPMGTPLPLISDEKLDILTKEVYTVIESGIVNSSEKELRKGERLRIMDEKKRLRKKILRIESIPTPSEAAEEAALRFSQHYSPENRRNIQNEIAILLGRIMTGNLVYDDEETTRRRKNVAEQIRPIEVDVKKGQMIMEKGMIVDEDTLRKYQAYVLEMEKLAGMGKFWRKWTTGALFSVIFVVLAGIYLYHIHPEVVRSNKQVGILAFVAIINIALNTFAISFFSILSPSHNLPPDIVISILPLAVSSVILSVLIGLRVALYVGLFVSLVAAIQLDNSFAVVLNGMVISIVSGFAVRFSKNYRDYFIRCVFAVSLTMPAIDALRLIGVGRPTEIILKALIIGIFSGIFIGILCMGILFLVETVFRAYSNMSLLSFCDYNHPLLKRMQMEAPGTYHHSLVVSTLAEQAAREISANPIEARVGALFHDIGKLAKPEYFTENNLDGQNKHQELSPRMSSIVILSHVKEGVELTLKYKLPKIVRETIEQHHGKDMISFFYKRALDENVAEMGAVHEWDYRYPGPLPKSKECTIVSLADAAEAASRSLEKPNPSKIDAIICEIFRKKIRDGQLDDADITMREIAIIRRSFAKTITTMMHGRISYPKDEKDEEGEFDLFGGSLRKNTK